MDLLLGQLRANATGGEPIDVRCFDFLVAIATQGAIAQVIGHDEDDVGLGR